MSTKAEDPSVAELINRLSQQSSQLIHDEIRLAKAEMSAKVHRAGQGAGGFGVAGALALYAGGALVAAAILGLAVAISPWLSALIVGVVLLAVAAIAALVGRRQMKRATPPLPTETMDNVRMDLQELRGSRHRGDG
jgi:putative superfamily III holin-X